MAEDSNYNQVQGWSKSDFNDWAHEYRVGRIDTTSVIKSMGRRHITTTSSTVSSPRDLLDKWNRAKRDCSSLMVFKNDNQF